MRVFVTGGSGIIGGYVLRALLTAGHEVTNYSRTRQHSSDVRFVPGDILDLNALKLACVGHDAFVHLAAVPGPGRASPDQLLHVNVQGTVHTLEAAVQANIPKFVFASSGAASGFSFQTKRLVPQYAPIDEEHPCRPQDDYGLSKLLSEIACRRYSDAFGISTLCLRINNNWYLDRRDAEQVVQSSWARGMTVEQIWSGRYRRMVEDRPDDVWPTPGPPLPANLLWAVTDARDGAQAFVRAIETDGLHHEIFNITAADTCSLRPSLDLMCVHYPETPLTKPLSEFETLVSHEKAARLLGYRPQFSWRKSEFAEWLSAKSQALKAY
jgi:nucleoside-diphosphate-sugar epimerase